MSYLQANLPCTVGAGRTPPIGGKSRGLEEASVHWHTVVYANKHRADGRVEPMLPEHGVFGTRQTRSGQEQYAWSQPTTLQVSQEQPAGVCWQELAPPGGELTAQADGYNCHKMASRAITPSLAVCPPSPCLASSMGPRCYNFATQRGPALRVCCTHQGLLFRLSS
jgi:hypothetical protein